MKKYLQEYREARKEHVKKIVGNERSPLKKCRMILDAIPNCPRISYHIPMKRHLSGLYLPRFCLVVMHRRYAWKDSTDKYLVIFHELAHYLQENMRDDETVLSPYLSSRDEIICEIASLLVLSAAGCIGRHGKEIGETLSAMEGMDASSMAPPAHTIADRILGI